MDRLVAEPITPIDALEPLKIDPQPETAESVVALPTPEEELERREGVSPDQITKLTSFPGT